MATGKGSAVQQAIDFSAMQQTLAHHDAALSNLSGRMQGVETKIDSLGSAIQANNVAITRSIGELTSQLQAEKAKPTFNMREMLSAVVHGAALFSMIVGGIIWVNTSIFSATVQAVDAHTTQIKELTGKLEELHRAKK